MRLRKTLKWEWYLPIIFLLALGSFAQSTASDTYQDEEDVNARVARISFIRGDARIKREGKEEDWESARINLPIVEGDRIETEPDSALEIQFDTNNFLRIAGNSFVKITNLRDEGIAVSLSEGTLSLRAFFFDKDRGFFEIDAPQTTVSVQKEGSYRIDGRKTNSDWVRVSVGNGGQARVYSQDAGFSIKSGRSAQIYITGDMAGEWESTGAAQLADEWDVFVAERDEKIRKRLDDAHYGKYYERDIYGAEDLNDYGEWIDSPDYGKVWRPYQRSINQYANWTPYRYGSWQWVSPYGWTWVNDEPWGWATYHYGRWVSYRNTWVWCPYPSNRGRNRWRPALVAITYIDRDIHWYPLCYHQEYYDYNRHYRRNRNSRRDHRDHDRRDNRDDHRGHNRREGGWNNQHAIRNVPHSGVVSMPGDDFGRRRGRIRSADWRIAQRVLENEPRFEDDSFRPERRRDERVAGNGENQRRDRDAWRVRTGAADRRAGAPVEREINDNRVFNDRRRIERRERNQSEQNQNEQSPSIFSPGRRSSERSDTGAVERPNRRRDGERQNTRSEGNSPVIVREKNEETTGAGLGGVARPSRRERNPENSGSDGNAERERRREQRREQSQPPATTPPFNPNPPERRVETRREEPRREERRREEPRVETPRREERRSEPRREESRREEPRREERRADPPRVESRREEPRQEAPRREEPRREAPRREEPKREEPKREEKRERPPQNNNSESEKKTRPSIIERKKDPDDN